MDQSEWTPWYDPREREWCLWNGREVLRDDNGAVRFFISAQDAYDWLASETLR
jgi:hypothetical protein